MTVKTVKDLLVEELKDIYDAEHQLTHALPKLASCADEKSLAEAFTGHLKQTEGHIRRLDAVFDVLGETAKRKTCKAMVGLLEEGQAIMDEQAPPAIKDRALIAAAQKVEHYEIAAYGCLRTWAEMLGEDEAFQLLQETLDEEGAADKKLTAIAMALPDAGRRDEDDDEAVALVAARTKGSAVRSSHRGTKR